MTSTSNQSIRMQDNTGSFLIKTASVEQAEQEENKRAQDECNALIDKAKRDAQDKRATFPQELQEMKRSRFLKVRAEAEAEAADLVDKAIADASRVSEVADEIEASVLREIMERVLPVK